MRGVVLAFDAGVVLLYECPELRQQGVGLRTGRFGGGRIALLVEGDDTPVGHCTKHAIVGD